METLKSIYNSIILIIIIVVLLWLFWPSTKEKTIDEKTFNEMNNTGKIQYLINNTIDKETNLDDYTNRITNISVNDEISNISLILTADNGFSNEYIKETIYYNTQDIMKEFVSKFKNLDVVNFDWQFPLVDTYGNEELKTVVELQFTNETIYKTNWGNVIADNVPILAKFETVHPALNK